jgi:hypothetical protein
MTNVYPWWYERAVDKDEVEVEITALLAGGQIAPNEERAVAVERVVRRTVSDKLKEWLRGVASWGPEGRKEAIRSGKRMKELGYMQ